MTKVLNIAYRLRIFTLEELSEAAGMNISSLSSMLQRWQRKDMAMQIRRNLYCMTDPLSGQPSANRFEIGSHVTRSSYISYHTALEFHGMAHQPFNEVMISSCSRVTPFTFDDVDYHSYPDNAGTAGVFTPRGNPLVQVTDLERTLVDCFDRIDRAGGIEELVHCMESVVRLDETKLATYLELYGKSFLYQKTGFMLEMIKDRTGITDGFIETCREKGKNHVKWLTNNEESDTFIKEWRLYVPQIITDREEHELI